MAEDKNKDNQFDVVVIGSGPGGYVAAIRASQLGLSTAIVEKRETLGGTCLNIGCIPSKALLDSSEQFAKAKHSLGEHGIEVSGVSLNLETMMKRKDTVVGRLTGGVATLMKKNKIRVFTGAGKLEEGPGVTVTASDGSTTALSAKHVILASGSESVELPFMKFDGDRIVSSTEALEFNEVPEKLLVVGGGAIGLEMASVWSRLGSEVTVVELLPTLIPGWDAGLAKTLSREMKKQKITVMTGAQVKGAEVTGGKGGSGKGVSLSVTTSKGQDKTLEGDRVLVAVGRRAVTSGLGLEEAGVALDNGKVTVDRTFKTSVDGVYAIGDLIQGPMLAHKAEEDGVACAELIAGRAGHVDYDLVPNVVYTWPEVASVGKTEEQLKEAGTEYVTGQFSFAANGRALAMGDTAGFVKVLADATSDRVLGCHIIGPWASDLIAEAVSVMAFHGSSEDLARTVHAHPTLPEAVKEAALSASGMPLNSA